MVFLLLGLLSLLYVPVPFTTFFWKAVYNFGHIPLFGLVAILLLWVSRTFLKRPEGEGIQHYGMALLGVLVLALLTEALQSLNVARQPTVSDVFYDLLGAMCALILFFTYDTHATGPWGQWRKFPRNVLLRLGVLLVISITLLPVFEWAHAFLDRTNRFPSLLHFSSEWEMKFVKERNSKLQVVVPPVGWEKSTDDLVGEVEFHLKKSPGFSLEEPYPDWRGYTSLELDIYSELSSPQSIAIRIDDAEYNHTYADGFNRRIMVLPGLNHVQILIEDIRRSPESREMDLSSIKRVLLFAVSPPKEFILYFDNIRLE